jgi:hypothetical protein
MKDHVEVQLANKKNKDKGKEEKDIKVIYE